MEEALLSTERSKADTQILRLEEGRRASCLALLSLLQTSVCFHSRLDSHALTHTLAQLPVRAHLNPVIPQQALRSKGKVLLKVLVDLSDINQATNLVITTSRPMNWSIRPLPTHTQDARIEPEFSTEHEEAYSYTRPLPLL